MAVCDRGGARACVARAPCPVSRGGHHALAVGWLASFGAVGWALAV